jgi:DnaJ-class molecular chaperone
MTDAASHDESESPERGEVRVTCAFCGGKGVDPFGIMSEMAVCAECGGQGYRIMREPIAQCAFCGGTGVHPGTRMACTVCEGAGMVEVPLDGIVCPYCRGTGRAAEAADYPWHDSIFSCPHCGGKGIASREAA